MGWDIGDCGICDAGGFRLDPNPPQDGINKFSGADKVGAETLRDAYFSADPDRLTRYDRDSQLMIVLVYGGKQYFQNLANGVWVDTFNSATSTIDLSTHSVADLGDVSGVAAENYILLAGQDGTYQAVSLFDHALPKTLTDGKILVGDGSGVAQETDINELSLPVFIECHAGEDFSGAGIPVYISGTHESGKPIVSKADSASALTMPCIGLTASASSSGDDIKIQENGLLEGLNTDTYTAGQELYINGNGSLSVVRPVGTALVQEIGVVSRSHATVGSIVIQGAGRANELPNLPTGKVWQGDEDGVPQEAVLAAQSDFLVDNTSYTADFTAVWSYTYGEVDNRNGEIKISLPDATADDLGKEIKFWLVGNPANNKVVFEAFDTDGTINGQAAEGVNKAKADITSSEGSYTRITVQCMGEGDYHVDLMSSTYAAQRFVVNFTSTSDFSPYSYLEASDIVPTLLTDSGDWWFAIKVEQSMKNDSDGHVLFGSNNAFVAVRGDGTYFMTHSTSGYLQTISPNTIPSAGEWIIYQYDSSTNYYTAWINGVKVLNNTSSGVTMPSTAPSQMWFGSETGQASPPSGYGYPLQTCKISCIATGTGNITDVDAALFTHSQYEAPSLTGGVLTNQWKANASGMATDVGAIDFTPVGSDISFEEL